MKNYKSFFNGIAIYCKGNLEENPIIFLHGNSLSSLTFQKQFEKIDLPLIAIDLPGHGCSSFAKNNESTYSIPGYTEIIIDIIKHLKIKKFILVGHSLGGHIAINVASKLSHAVGLLIFGTPPLASVQSIESAFLPNPSFPLLLQNSLSLVEATQLAKDMLFQQEHVEVLKNDILTTDPSARSSFGAFIAKGIIVNEVEIIKTRHFPTAIIHGERDSFINKEYIDGVGFSNLWEKKIHQISDSGHCSQIEQSNVFDTLLTDYHKFIFR